MAARRRLDDGGREITPLCGVALACLPPPGALVADGARLTLEGEATMRNPSPTHAGSLIAAGTLLGIGLGGLADGILLRQILQWHHVLSARLPATDLSGLQMNLVWDGILQAFVWLTTLVGVLLLWHVTGRRDVPRSTRTFAGSLALGCGLFNVIEGTIAHQVLQVHHVRPGDDQLSWDVAFLIAGAALTAAGWTALDHRRRG
jgi:uncharacterized membrane protein